MSWESLAFEERQRKWEGHQRQFRQHHGRAERPSVWEISVQGDRVYIRHGLLDGAMQETNYAGKAKNVGRSNAITAEQDALAEARRDCRKKWDFEGYDEYVGDRNIDCRHQNISIQALLTNLPGSFSLYKPEHNLYDQKKLLAKAQKGQALYTLKRDGIAKLIVVDYWGNVQLYSRRARPWCDKEAPKEMPDGTLDYSTMVLWAQRFPHLVEAVKALELPPGSMLAAELVAPGGDNFPYVHGLTKGYTARALADMATSGLPHLYWWDLPFYGGEDLVHTLSVKERFAKLYHHWGIGQDKAVGSYIQPIQYMSFATPEDAEAYAKSSGFEGYVVVDPDSVYGDRGWNLKGKPDRPSTCAKLKPSHEDDFVAYWDPDHGWGEWGTGDNEAGKTVRLPDGSQVVHGGVGSIGLFQYNSDGELVFVSKCGTGMDYDFQSRLRKEHFPFVCKVEYKGRTYTSDGEKTNALRHPSFICVRDDKKPEECVNTRL